MNLSSFMNGGMNSTSPVRKSYAPKSMGGSMLCNSAFFGPASPSKNQEPDALNTSTKDITDTTHTLDRTVTPLSMYNQSFNINKELQNIIEQLRLELTQQREHISALNKSYTTLQSKYHEDTQSMAKKIEALNHEKFDLTKDLDLALERERNALKDVNSTDKSDKQHVDNIVNEYRDQIAMLKEKLNQHHEERLSITQMMATMDCLSSKMAQQHSKSDDRHEKMKMMFEDTTLQLEQYHKSQEEICSLSHTVDELKGQRTECIQFLHHFLSTLPPEICPSDQFHAITDWQQLKATISATSTSLCAMIADHERTEKSLRNKLNAVLQEGASETDKERMEELEIENITLKEEVKKRGTEIQLWMGNNKVIEESNEKLCTANDTLKAQITTLETTLEEQIKTFEAERNTFSERLDSEFVEYRQKVNGMNAEIDRLTAENEILRNEKKMAITEKVTEIEFSSERISELKEEIRTLSAIEEQMNLQRAAEREKNGELSATIEMMRDELAENEQNNQHNLEMSLNLTKEKEHLMAENEGLNMQITSYQQQVEDQRGEIVRVTQQRDQFQEQFEDLKTKQEINALNEELETTGNTKLEIMKSYIMTDALGNRGIKNGGNQMFKDLTVETDATPMHSELYKKLTLEKEQLTKQCGSMKQSMDQYKKRMSSMHKMNRELKSKFQTNKKNTIVKYEQIAKKVATMREMITSKDEECCALKEELEVSHRQFFKLLHHSASKHDVTTAGRDDGSVGSVDLNNLEEMRKQLKVLERNFNI